LRTVSKWGDLYPIILNESGNEADQDFKSLMVPAFVSVDEREPKLLAIGISQNE
jgi:hypothetical protein